MFRRIDGVEAAGQNSAGCVRQCGAVSGPVNPARQPRDNQKAPCAKLSADLRSEFQTCSRSIPRTHHGNRRPFPDAGLSLHVKQRRRCLDMGKERRITGLMNGLQGHASRSGPFQFRFGRPHS